MNKAMLKPTFSFQIVKNCVLNIPPGPDHLKQDPYVHFQTGCYNHDLGMLAIWILHRIFDEAKRLTDVLHREE